MTHTTREDTPQAATGVLHGLGPLPDYSDAPVVVFWETTRACALKCIHCRAAAQPLRHPLELNTLEGYRLLDELATFDPAPIVILTGGDPLMRRDLFDLIAHGIGLGLRMSLSPSVTKMVTYEVLLELRNLGLSRLSFSLDGSGAHVHDSFRGVRDSFDQTIARMQDALSVGLSLQINTTVSRHNLRDLPRTAEVLRSISGIVLWDLFFLVPTGRGQRGDAITPEEHEQVYKWLYDLGPTLPFGIKTTLGPHYRRVTLQSSLRAGESLIEAWSKIHRSSSNEGKGVCFISHLGDIYPSGFLPISCGNIRRDSLTETYRSHPTFQALRDPDRLRGKCGRCPFRFICGGCRSRAYAFTGDYLGPEPSCSFEPDGWTPSSEERLGPRR